MDVSVITDRGQTAELEIRFLEDDGEDSNVYNARSTASIFYDLTCYLQEIEAFPYHFHIKVLPNFSRAFRVWVFHLNRGNDFDGIDSGCEDCSIFDA